jgi:shikimate kinase
MGDDTDARIAQLQTQQALLTQAMAAALEGRWQGAGSVEAYLYAIAPDMQGQLAPDPPSYA